MPDLNLSPFNAEPMFKSELMRILDQIDKSHDNHGKIHISLETRNTIVNFLTINPDKQVCLDILVQKWPNNNFSVVRLTAQYMEFKGDKIESLQIQIQTEAEQGNRHAEVDSSGKQVYQIYVVYEIRRKDDACSCTLQ